MEVFLIEENMLKVAMIPLILLFSSMAQAGEFGHQRPLTDDEITTGLAACSSHEVTVIQGLSNPSEGQHWGTHWAPGFEHCGELKREQAKRAAPAKPN
jgi:hypothetical protein